MTKRRRQQKQGNIRKQHSVKLRKRQKGGTLLEKSFSMLAENVIKKAVSKQRNWKIKEEQT